MLEILKKIWQNGNGIYIANFKFHTKYWDRIKNVHQKSQIISAQLFNTVMYYKMTCRLWLTQSSEHFNSIFCFQWKGFCHFRWNWNWHFEIWQSQIEKKFLWKCTHNKCSMLYAVCCRRKQFKLLLFIYDHEWVHLTLVRGESLSWDLRVCVCLWHRCTFKSDLLHFREQHVCVLNWRDWT